MSAGSALLESHSHFDTSGGVFGLNSISNAMESNNNSTNSSSAFSDEDLIASLSGFRVEGQTERDLATIKAMLMQNGGINNFNHAGSSSSNGSNRYNIGGHNNHNNYHHHHHNSFSNSNNGGVWPISSSPAWQGYAQSSQQQFGWQQPPPNTPTLSKSMELYGQSASSSTSGGGYFGQGSPMNGFSALHASTSRRRDVSLERPQHPLSRNSSRHARASSISTTGGGDAESSSSAGFDMEMGADDSDAAVSAGVGGIDTFASPAAGEGGSSSSSSGLPVGYTQQQDAMEDIEEDSMREAMEDETNVNGSIRAPQHAPGSSIFNSSSSSPAAHRQLLDNRSDPLNRASNNSTPSSTIVNPPTSRPASSASFAAFSASSGSTPPQTRSRSRQQQQAQQQQQQQQQQGPSLGLRY